LRHGDSQNEPGEKSKYFPNAMSIAGTSALRQACQNFTLPSSQQAEIRVSNKIPSFLNSRLNLRLSCNVARQNHLNDSNHEPDFHMLDIFPPCNAHFRAIRAVLHLPELPLPGAQQAEIRVSNKIPSFLNTRLNLRLSRNVARQNHLNDLNHEPDFHMPKRFPHAMPISGRSAPYCTRQNFPLLARNEQKFVFQTKFQVF
jgi:hypothetical protein